MSLVPEIELVADPSISSLMEYKYDAGGTLPPVYLKDNPYAEVVVHVGSLTQNAFQFICSAFEHSFNELEDLLGDMAIDARHIRTLLSDTSLGTQEERTAIMQACIHIVNWIKNTFSSNNSAFAEYRENDKTGIAEYLEEYDHAFSLYLDFWFKLLDKNETPVEILIYDFAFQHMCRIRTPFYEASYCIGWNDAANKVREEENKGSLRMFIPFKVPTLAERVFGDETNEPVAEIDYDSLRMFQPNTNRKHPRLEESGLETGNRILTVVNRMGHTRLE